MNQEDIVKYKSLYLQTSWGYLNMLRKNVSFLLNDLNNTEALGAAHIAAHSLKSQSILMEYSQIGKLSEKMEKLFNAKKENLVELDKEILNVVMAGLDKIQHSLVQISENGTDIDMTDEIGKLDKVLRGEKL